MNCTSSCGWSTSWEFQPFLRFWAKSWQKKSSSRPRFQPFLRFWVVDKLRLVVADEFVYVSTFLEILAGMLWFSPPGYAKAIFGFNPS